MPGKKSPPGRASRNKEREKSKKERKGIDKGDGRWYTIEAATESGSAKPESRKKLKKL